MQIFLRNLRMNCSYKKYVNTLRGTKFRLEYWNIISLLISHMNILNSILKQYTVMNLGKFLNFSGIVIVDEKIYQINS